MSKLNQPAPPAGGPLLDPEAAATLLNCSTWTLAEWRCKGTGPRYCKLGNRVRYTPAALTEWIEAHSGSSTSEHDAKKAG
jgi:predicted DNA-binding transcriptional regulator AlpA